MCAVLTLKPCQIGSISIFLTKTLRPKKICCHFFQSHTFHVGKIISSKEDPWDRQVINTFWLLFLNTISFQFPSWIINVLSPRLLFSSYFDHPL